MNKSLAMPLLAALGACMLGVVSVQAQEGDQPAAPGRGGRGGQPALRPGFVLPPENAGGRYAGNGEPYFKERCASCHDPAVGRAPLPPQTVT